MSTTIEFKSHVPVAQRTALEALVFFNSCQERVSACIADAIERFGAPEIVADRDRLRIHMKDMPDVQSLFAIDTRHGTPGRRRCLCASGRRARHGHAPRHHRRVRERRSAGERAVAAAPAARSASLDASREGCASTRAVLRERSRDDAPLAPPPRRDLHQAPMSSSTALRRSAIAGARPSTFAQVLRLRAVVGRAGRRCSLGLLRRAGRGRSTCSRTSACSTWSLLAICAHGRCSSCASGAWPRCRSLARSCAAVPCVAYVAQLGRRRRSDRRADLPPASRSTSGIATRTWLAMARLPRRHAARMSSCCRNLDCGASRDAAGTAAAPIRMCAASDRAATARVILRSGRLCSRGAVELASAGANRAASRRSIGRARHVNRARRAPALAARPARFPLAQRGAAEPGRVRRRSSAHRCSSRATSISRRGRGISRQRSMTRDSLDCARRPRTRAVTGRRSSRRWDPHRSLPVTRALAQRQRAPGPHSDRITGRWWRICSSRTLTAPILSARAG